MANTNSHSSQIRIVLVRPRNPLNIGAAARAMLNFGFDDLVVVAPYDLVWRESKAAAGAKQVLQLARAVDHLQESIQDCTFVIGTSSLSRRHVNMPVLGIEKFGELRGELEGRAAILFGSEKTGLSNADLSYCHVTARIPTGLECPSMNLGQAVAVCCYELRRVLGAGQKIEVPALGSQRATIAEIDRLSHAIADLAKGAHANGRQREGSRAIDLRRILLRWPITHEEVASLLGVIRDIEWQLKEQKRR